MKISVCMATYNGEQFIRDQIASILTQLGDEDELVISDDGSTDYTLSIIREFQDDRIKLVLNNERKGIIGNFENSLRASRGDIVFLADQDDWWAPNKIPLMTDLLVEYDLVVCDAELVDSNGNVVNDSFFAQNRSKMGLVNNFVKNSYLGCAMGFKRHILEVALPFPDRLPMHDWWLGLIAEIYGQTCFAPQKLIKHRLHDSNASPTGKVSGYNMATKIGFRLRIGFSLLELYCRRVLKG